MSESAPPSKAAVLRPFSFLLRLPLRPLLIAGTCLFIFVEIVALSPSSLEEGRGASSLLDPASLVRNEGPHKATGVPVDKIPDNSVDQFEYVSTQNGVKQWKLLADKAFFYDKERIVHARSIVAYLYDPDGKATVVTGNEAKYLMNGKDLEIFGNVKSTFPDGFTTYSQYMKYLADDKRVQIPLTEPVSGRGDEQDGQKMAFTSLGLDYAMKKKEIVLPKAARVLFTKQGDPNDAAGVPDTTLIESDHCVIQRDIRIAHFTMYPNRPSADRFVLITQPKLFARGRRADMNYGDYAKLLNYLVAYDDVIIKERQTGKALKYATGGRADFDSKRDLIVLTRFPQVYQNDDTVTGEVIVLHRDTDVVEVEHSNSFSEGGDDDTESEAPVKK